MISHRPPSMAGHRFSNQRTSYGSGDSSPPTQNGQPWVGRLGRSCRDWVMTTTAPVRGSMRRSATPGRCWPVMSAELYDLLRSYEIGDDQVIADLIRTLRGAG